MTLQCAGNETQQNHSFYNGWVHEQSVTNLIIFTPDGKIQTRVSNLNPDQIKSYSLPVNTEIFIANLKQEAFAMKGNDIKSTDVKPYIVLKDSDEKRIIVLSSLEKNRKSTQ